jgi:hypothetical protein
VWLGRINSGPLAPDHGGTGDSETDFGTLTGGKFGPAPADKGYPPGTLVGDNGISHRPETAKDGPRIDIPANGTKPSETLHYPKSGGTGSSIDSGDKISRGDLLNQPGDGSELFRH